MTNLLTRLDTWLIDNPYQGLVDISQRKPTWWAQQCVLGSLVMFVIQFVLFPQPGVWKPYAFLGVNTITLSVLWLATLSPALFAWIGAARPVRCFILVLLLTNLYIDEPTRDVLVLFGNFGVTSVYYFAACKPPRPRVPRTKLAGAGGAA